MNGIQIISCKCGKTFAGCNEPECYLDKKWMKDIRKSVKKGCSVKVVPLTEFSFGKCECDK